jgi:hypothetical protein
VEAGGADFRGAESRARSDRSAEPWRGPCLDLRTHADQGDVWLAEWQVSSSPRGQTKAGSASRKGWKPGSEYGKSLSEEYHDALPLLV